MGENITIDFLRSLPELREKEDELLRTIVEKLKKEWITTIADLQKVSRESLIQINFPLLVITALQHYLKDVQSEVKHQHQTENLTPAKILVNKKPRLCPPSAGKARPKISCPRKSPSSDEGKLEGSTHASCDSNVHMQCTSTPATIDLLKILVDAAKAQQNARSDKFITAAEYLCRARNISNTGNLQDIGTNERFFTGAMANALNSVLENGFCVLHQSCLGVGATHSDLSATRIKTDDLSSWPTTLLVGEGKWKAQNNLREETRGQIMNELRRHRAIDQSSANGNNGPILLMAFDTCKVEIDLAFPSKKGGKLEQDKVVDFSEAIGNNEETFWTIRILRMDIDETKGKKNLPIVFRFVANALEKLDSWTAEGRAQYKMPMPLISEDKIEVVKYCGDNVTVIKNKEEMFIYKEYCYHLRQECNVMAPLLEIKDEDKRQPPPKNLLNQLGPPYSTWAVEEGPFGTSVLRYRFIVGCSYRPSVAGWLQILEQIQLMHKAGFVHGDLLPRNVLFTDEGCGYVIDFDLSRKLPSNYVRGYNYEDFRTFRHKGATALKPMKKDHDLHSLKKMSNFFFTLTYDEISTINDIGELIDFFVKNNQLGTTECLDESDAATGSPKREN